MVYIDTIMIGGLHKILDLPLLFFFNQVLTGIVEVSIHSEYLKCFAYRFLDITGNAILKFQNNVWKM